MFQNDSVAGSWPALLIRLDLRSTGARWGEHEPAMADYPDAAALAARLHGRVYGPAGDDVVAGLVRLAQTGDGDALLFTLHCLSGVAQGLARDLRDLHEDILSVVVGELSCQIMSFPIARRQRAIAESLRLETRRGVLAELKPTVRNHPEWAEQVTGDGRVETTVDKQSTSAEAEDVDLIDLLLWARGAGITQSDLQLLVDVEQARANVAGRWQRSARAVDSEVARRHGVCTRTLYRRRKRALTELRIVAREYLAAVA